MVSMTTKISMGIMTGVIGSGIGAAWGAFSGFVYSKFADLPAGQVIKAWAVMSAVECALHGFIYFTFSENRVAKGLVSSAVWIATTAIGIEELQKRGLIGQKMTIFLIAARTLLVATQLFTTARASTAIHPRAREV